MSTMRELFTQSLSKINAVGVNEVPSPADMDLCIAAFNSMLDSWSAERLAVYTIDPYYFLLVAGQKDYKLGPALDDDGNATGADWVIPRPMQIQQAYVSYGATVQIIPPSSTDTIWLWNFDTAGDAGPPATYADSRLLTNVITISGTPQEQTATFDDSFSEFGDAGSLVMWRTGPYSVAIPLPLPATSAAAIASPTWTFEFSTYWQDDLTQPTGNFLVINDGSNQQISMSFQTGEGNYAVYFLDDNGDEIVHAFTAQGTWTKWAVELDATNNVANFYHNGTQLFSESWDGSMYGGANSAMPDQTTQPDPFNIDVEIVPLAQYGSDPVQSLWLDEMRLSKSVLYGANYTPLAAPFPVPPPDGPGQTIITENQQTTDIPMEILNDAQYASINVKMTPSTFPVKFYDNGNYPCRTLSMWPVPTQQNAVVLWLWEPLINKDSLDEQLAMPKGYERALMFNLAVEIAPDFGKEVPPQVMDTARLAKGVIKRLNDGQQIMVGDIALAQTGAGLFNWQIGTTVPN